MTELARLSVNPTSRSALRDLADPVALHRRVMAAFPPLDTTDPRAVLGVLWRLDTGFARDPILLVQSHEPGDWTSLPDGWFLEANSKRIDAALDSLDRSRRLRFLLRANASRKIKTMSTGDGTRRNGQRVPLRSEASALAWLEGRAASAGFVLAAGPSGVAVRVQTEGAAMGRRGDRVVTVQATRFEGLLEVTDPELLARAVRSGIGPAKAFGCGLLSLAPA